MPGYIPPHKRNKAASPTGDTAEASPQKNAPNDTETVDHYYTTAEVGEHFEGKAYAHHTISDGTAENGSIARIVLHLDQHPDWDLQHDILLKSNLHLLSADLTSDAEAREHEYPLFEGVIRRHRPSFKFSGWWRIKAIRYLEPNSPELIAMFERKFNVGRTNRRGQQGRGRTEGAWKASLSSRWAVLTLEKNPDRCDNPLPNDLGAVQKHTSVTEMLRRLRMGDEAKTETGGAEKQTGDNSPKPPVDDAAAGSEAGRVD